MSHIFLQKDNITILGDVYEYPIHKHDENNICIETITQKTVMLQVILVVNWKQRLFWFRTDLQWYSRIVHDWSEWENSPSLKLKDYNTWNVLKEFLETIWYEVDFNLQEQIDLSQKD